MKNKSNDKKILLSIIIPTFKRNDNLERALNSILMEKGAYEIIVVDDNDSDTIYRKNNELLMKKYLNKYNNIKYLKHSKNMNGATARNTGIQNSEGIYITFLDDDDEFINCRISELLYLINNYDYDLIYSGYCHYLNGKKINEYIINNTFDIPSLQFELLCQKSFFGTGSNIVLKKEIVEKINYFDTKFQRHQDIEFILRYLDNTNSIYCITKNLVKKNLDDTSNLPNFNKMYDTKILFLNKFDYMIKRFNCNMQNDIYKINYYQLFQIACKNSSKSDQNRCIKLLKEKNIYNPFAVFSISFLEKLKKIYIIKIIRPIIGK